MTVIVNQDMSPKAEDRAMAEWLAATSDADEVIGYSLVGGNENEETLDKLTGVPFLIERISFRHGDIIPDGQKEARDYVSVECLISPAHQAKFKRDRVVFNDGSTGVYRQCVAYLAAKGLISVPDDRPEKGNANTTRYDLSYTEPIWGPDGTEHWTSPEFPVAIVAPEGLRKSEYPNPDGSKGTTWYLA